MYELIDLDTANLVGSYATAAEALQMVRAAATRYGNDCVAALALGLVEDDEDRTIAVGSALLELALTAIPPAEPRSA